MNHKGFIADRSIEGAKHRNFLRQVKEQGIAEVKKYRIRAANERNRLERPAQMSRRIYE